MRPNNLPEEILSKRAIVYVRQSTGIQVAENLESQRRQYELADLAKGYGFRDVVTIDEDLGRSASGTTARPGFESLVGQLCQNLVGAVFCLEASRLARNGRDWHHLLELCGLVGARVVDTDGVYDPGLPNDRLLLGLKGTMSEFELTVIRRRLIDALFAKARRGELRIAVPVGYTWTRETGLEKSPDKRIQEAINSVFRLYDRLGSARQVLLLMRKDKLLFPRPLDGKTLKEIVWRAPVYRNVISVLTNPFYAGAYAYGKSEHRTKLIGGRLSKTYGHYRPMNKWTTVLHDHHSGYITWKQFEGNQERLRANAFRKSAGEAKAGRGGHALLTGLLRCRRCGRMLSVGYSGRGYYLIRYSCRLGNTMHGLEPCINFGSTRPDQVMAMEILKVVQPMALEAAIKAEERAQSRDEERRRALELERQQAEYEVRLAQKRYESVDPDNRLVASELEARWNAALNKLRECENRLKDDVSKPVPKIDRDTFFSLACDLEAAWNSPTTTMRMKQQLVRTLIREIVVDVDDKNREVILLIHWHGGQHSELRVQKPKSGEHRRVNGDDADKIIREMSTKWSDEHIAATLNRMGFKTGQDHTWSKHRVETHRKKRGIVGYASRIKDGKCLTMFDAAKAYGVSNYKIRKLIQNGLLPAQQVVEDAPWQILREDLERPEVQKALRSDIKGPCRRISDDRTLMIPGI